MKPFRSIITCAAGIRTNYRPNRPFHVDSALFSSGIPASLKFNTIRQLSTSTRLRERPPPIKLTEKAASRIKELMSSKQDAAGVRISVRRRGCNGYTYTMNYSTEEEAKKNKDEVVQSHGVKVFVDPKAIFFIVGTEMDFLETELSSEFTFTNPNSKGSCGCGESFNV